MLLVQFDAYTTTGGLKKTARYRYISWSGARRFRQ